MSTSKTQQMLKSKLNTANLKSLEECILESGNKFTTVDKSKKYDENIPVNTIVVEHKKRSHDSIDNDKDAIFWKDKYNKLKASRNESEEDLDKQIKLSIEKEKKLNEYINYLEKRLDLSNTDVSSTVMGTSAVVSYNKNKDEKLLKFFEHMTSMSVVVDDDNTYICSVKNKLEGKTTKFIIRLNDDETEASFLPKSNMAMLPEYLRAEEVAFEPTAMPVVMGDILQLLYDEN